MFKTFIRKLPLLAVIIPLLAALTAGIILDEKTGSFESNHVHNMEVKNMKRTEKQIETGRYYLARYNASNAYELSDVYKSYSVYKARAMRYCKEQAEMHGSTAKIISHNCNFFTVAYPVHIDHTDCIIIETAYNTYVYPVE